VCRALVSQPPDHHSTLSLQLQDADSGLPRHEATNGPAKPGRLWPDSPNSSHQQVAVCHHLSRVVTARREREPCACDVLIMGNFVRRYIHSIFCSSVQVFKPNCSNPRCDKQLDHAYGDGLQDCKRKLPLSGRKETGSIEENQGIQAECVNVGKPCVYL